MAFDVMSFFENEKIEQWLAETEGNMKYKTFVHYIQLIFFFSVFYVRLVNSFLFVEMNIH